MCEANQGSNFWPPSSPRFRILVLDAGIIRNAMNE